MSTEEGALPRESLEKRGIEPTVVAAESARPPFFSYGGEDRLPPPPQLSPTEEKALYRKIDMRLIPILTLMYLCSFLDRGNIGNAKLQGLVSQLHLDGNKYNIALTMYFVPYCLFECPSNLVLKKFRPSRWLPGITASIRSETLHGTLMGLVKNFPQFVGARICLGVAEAGLFPGVVYYLTIWYPRHMIQLRIGIFFGGATLAGAFSGLIAYAISFMSGTCGLLGWSWIFILEGILTVLVGIISLFILVDFPHTATFLTPEERAYVIYRKKYDNSSVGEEENFEMRHIREILLDWQLWPQILIYMATISPLYGISLFLPFGFDAAISQLLTVPPYVFATSLLLVWAIWSDRIKRRFPFVFAGHVLTLIGFSINISAVSIGPKYFGIFLIVGGTYAGFPGVVAWLGNNLTGHYQRGVGMALQISVGNFGAIVSSNVYLAQDAPRYILGHGIELMFVAIGLIVTPITMFLYKRINAQRDARQEEADEKVAHYTPEEIRRLGHRAPDFRYTL
ncbi:MFS general substrate transporter [Trametes elegans]|nr:MFS general substrate transporter [Trametes elegans]